MQKAGWGCSTSAQQEFPHGTDHPEKQGIQDQFYNTAHFNGLMAVATSLRL